MNAVLALNGRPLNASRISPSEVGPLIVTSQPSNQTDVTNRQIEQEHFRDNPLRVKFSNVSTASEFEVVG